MSALARLLPNNRAESEMTKLTSFACALLIAIMPGAQAGGTPSRQNPAPGAQARGTISRHSSAPGVLDLRRGRACQVPPRPGAGRVAHRPRVAIIDDFRTPEVEIAPERQLTHGRLVELMLRARLPRAEILQLHRSNRTPTSNACALRSIRRRVARGEHIDAVTLCVSAQQTFGRIAKLTGIPVTAANVHRLAGPPA